MASNHQELLSFGQPVPGQPLHRGIENTYLNSTMTLLTEILARHRNGTEEAKRDTAEHGHSYLMARLSPR